MKLEYTLTINDYFNYHFYMFLTSNEAKRSLYIQWFSMVVLCLIVAFVFYNAYGFEIGVILMLFYTFIMLIFYPKFFNYQCKKRILKFVKKTYGESKNVRFEVTEYELFCASDVSEFKIKNSAFKKAVKTDENLFLMADNGIGIVLKSDKDSISLARNFGLEPQNFSDKRLKNV
ncbi:hypothetical protein [Campylobacter mucosalis]|uniref:hypothetical protein n=1 Tax=Campylobacter mucosalis TaxID=202 RepID=UPI0014705134|nr:hypothetical protein [Campylobacter mucosalis]